MPAAPPGIGDPQITSNGSYYDWAKDLLQALGFDDSNNNIVSIVSWCNAEGTTAVFNPLATTQPMPKATDFNSVGVKNYDSWDDGLKATVTTLRNGNYQGILLALKNSSAPTTTCARIDSSPWGTKLALQVAMSIQAGGGYNSVVFRGYARKKVSDGGKSIFHKATDAVTAPLNYAKSAYDELNTLTNFFGDTHNYYRLGQILMGAALFILGLYITVKASPASSLVAT